MDELSKIGRARITPLHGLIVVLSLLMTVGAWQFSADQIKTKTKARFEQSRDQVIVLLRDRMLKYEDALWSGVAMLQSHGGDVAYGQWQTFARNLRIDEKYPGINGIGVIHFVDEAGLPDYLARRQAERPAFRIHPPHDAGVYMPISFIEPEDTNAAAVGLDVAHEQNRRTAAQASHDTGTAQITGPIVLVQDAGRTPGFLFYAPFGNAREFGDFGARGAVYAPFVVRKLMEGLLSKDLRNVHFSIVDDGEAIYDEHGMDDPTNDPDPMFSETVSIDLYGRTWVLDIRTSTVFRAENTYSEPTFILIGGLVIEVLIITMLVLMARANSRAVAYAGRVTESLREKSEALEATNTGLAQAQRRLEAQNEVLAKQNLKIETDHDRLQAALRDSEELRREQAEFTYAVSHDLKAPANTMQMILSEMATEHSDKWDDGGREFLAHAQKTAGRMIELIGDILSYSWATNEQSTFERIDMKVCLAEVLADMTYDIEQTGAKITTGEMEAVFGSKTQVRMLVQNLINNGIKFQKPGSVPEIHVEVRATGDADDVVLSVRDNGIGIDPEYHERIFGMFQRMHAQDEYQGTGLGLTTCRRIAQNHGGKISIRSAPGQGSTFSVLLRSDRTGDANGARKEVA